MDSLAAPYVDFMRGEARMTNDEGSSNARVTNGGSDLVIPSGFDIRHSSFFCE